MESTEEENNNLTESRSGSACLNVSTERTKKNVKKTNYNNTATHYECKNCQRQFSKKTSHTILKRHATKHDEQDDDRKKHKRESIYLRYDNLIVNFVIRGTHSFKIVEEEHFKKMIKGLNPNYPGLTRHKLNLNIQELFQNKKTKLIECIDSIDKLSVTFDFWTSVTNKPYIVITAHFVHGFNLHSIVLDFDLIPYPHTSDQILSRIKEIFDSYGMQKKVLSITTDNEAVNVKLMQLLSVLHTEYEEVIHTRCLAHILNLTVKKGLKKLSEPVSSVAKLVNIINFSPKKKQLYASICDLLKVSHLALVREMPIRWNSTYLMLERAYNMRNVLDYICIHTEEFQKHLIQEWDTVKIIIEFLKPFYDATLMLSKSKYPSIMYVIPIIDVLMGHISRHCDDDFLKDCAYAMAGKLNEYIPLLRTNYAKFAVILDPRLKNNYFDHQEPLESLTEYYKIKYEQKSSNTNQQSETTSCAPKNIFSSIYKPKDTVRDELQQYLSMPLESEDTDILQWWINHAEHYPQLHKLAFNILSIPATSVPSEQAFSKSGDLINKKRNRLDATSIQASMCLASWLKFFKD